MVQTETAPSVVEFKGTGPIGQFLLELWEDGSRTVKYRVDQFDTWSAPVELFAVPAWVMAR